MGSRGNALLHTTRYILQTLIGKTVVILWNQHVCAFEAREVSDRAGREVRHRRGGGAIRHGRELSTWYVAPSCPLPDHQSAGTTSARNKEKLNNQAPDSVHAQSEPPVPAKWPARASTPAQESTPTSRGRVLKTVVISP